MGTNFWFDEGNYIEHLVINTKDSLFLAIAKTLAPSGGYVGQLDR